MQTQRFNALVIKTKNLVRKLKKTIVDDFMQNGFWTKSIGKQNKLIYLGITTEVWAYNSWASEY